MNVVSRSIVLFLATVVFFTTTCFAMDVHYCESEIQSIALFHKAKPCGKMVKKEKQLSKCCMARKAKLEKESEGKTVFKKQKCCSNESVGFKGDVDQDAASVKVPSVAVKILSFPVDRTDLILEASVQQNEQYRGPPDPVRSFNFQVFFQVFRI